MTTDQILEQLFDDDRVIDTFKINSKISFSLRSLSVQDYIDIEESLSELKGTKVYVLHMLGIERIARALVAYKGRKFESAKEAKEFLLKSNLPASVLEKLLLTQQNFEKLIRDALELTSVEQSFFEKAGSQIKQEPSQPALTSVDVAP